MDARAATTPQDSGVSGKRLFFRFLSLGEQRKEVYQNKSYLTPRTSKKILTFPVITAENFSSAAKKFDIVLRSVYNCKIRQVNRGR